MCLEKRKWKRTKSGGFAKGDADKIRDFIIAFCRKPRTRDEVSEEIGLNNLSTAAFLSGLQGAAGRIAFDPKMDTFVAIPKRAASRMPASAKTWRSGKNPVPATGKPPWVE